MRATKRDLIVAAGAASLTCSIGVLAQAPHPLIGPSVFEWSTLSAQKTDVGEIRNVARGPTATLEELEIHVTTLNPGLASHPPHQHPNEELLIIREGNVEALVSGELKRIGPGSIIFQASNQLHNIKNVGDTPATYHVINWKTAATPKPK